MKTLQEIKDEYAKDMACSNYAELLNKLTWSGEFEEMEKFHDEVAKRFAIEVAKEALRNASENIDQKKLDYENPYDYSVGVTMVPNTENIESVLDENNIPSI